MFVLIKLWHRILVGGILLSVAGGAAVPLLAQDRSSLADVALDLYTALRNKSQPVGISLSLHKSITAFRQDCTRIQEFQVFSEQPNIYHLKVKCPSLPLYGVTVAANGYLAVYGGNGIIGNFEIRHGRIYSFNPDGSLAPEVVPELKDVIGQSLTDMQEENTDEVYYMGIVFSFLGFILVGGFLVWLKNWRRLKANVISATAIDSDQKNRLAADSDHYFSRIYKHPAELYIVRGGRGKRRVFTGPVGAILYRYVGIKIGELKSKSDLTDYLEAKLKDANIRDVDD